MSVAVSGQSCEEEQTYTLYAPLVTFHCFAATSQLLTSRSLAVYDRLVACENHSFRRTDFYARFSSYRGQQAALNRSCRSDRVTRDCCIAF